MNKIEYNQDQFGAGSIWGYSAGSEFKVVFRIDPNVTNGERVELNADILAGVSGTNIFVDATKWLRKSERKIGTNIHYFPL